MIEKVKETMQEFKQRNEEILPSTGRLKNELLRYIDGRLMFVVRQLTGPHLHRASVERIGYFEGREEELRRLREFVLKQP